MNDDVASLGTILGIWAHPDDEAYLMGGVMALAADAGQRVACVTATLGDAGETADAERWPRHELRAIRREELVTAMDILGVVDHECLDLDDATLERKVRALEAHGSQTTGIIAALGRERYREWVRLEAFQASVVPAFTA